MNLAAWMEIAVGVLRFPDTILKIIKLLKSTPEENHEALVKSLSEEAKQYEISGRPLWPWN